MIITLDTLVSDVLAEYPEATELFKQFGVDVESECGACMSNPLELCETLCDIPNIEELVEALQEKFGEK